MRKSVVNFAQPGQLFEDLGITYIGVVPGHDLRALLEHTFRRALAARACPVIVHVRTQKGRGYHPAETDQVGFHGAALPPMSDPAERSAGRQASPFGARRRSSPSRAAPGRPQTVDDAVRRRPEQAEPVAKAARTTPPYFAARS